MKFIQISALAFFFIFFGAPVSGQEKKDSVTAKWSFVPTVYCDLYGSHTVGDGDSTILYQHPIKRGVGLNHAVAGFSLTNPKKNLSFNLAGQYGDFVSSNYGSDRLCHIYDANITWTVKKFKMEAGIFGSHFFGPYGTKSWDNPTSSFSKLSENTPYGNFTVQVTYTHGPFAFTQAIMPGYQKLGYDNNRQWSVGQRIAYAKGPWSVNLAALYGNEQDRGLQKKTRILLMPDAGYEFKMFGKNGAGEKVSVADCKIFVAGAWADEGETGFEAVSINAQMKTSHRILFGWRMEYAKSDLFSVPAQWNQTWSFGYQVNKFMKIRFDAGELGGNNRLMLALQARVN